MARRRDLPTPQEAAAILAAKRTRPAAPPAAAAGPRAEQDAEGARRQVRPGLRRAGGPLARGGGRRDRQAHRAGEADQGPQRRAVVAGDPRGRAGRGDHPAPGPRDPGPGEPVPGRRRPCRSCASSRVRCSTDVRAEPPSPAAACRRWTPPPRPGSPKAWPRRRTASSRPPCWRSAAASCDNARAID